MALGDKNFFTLAVKNPTSGNLPALTANGQLQDSGLPTAQVSIRPNLLDNWYFVGQGVRGKFPINQLGVSSTDDVSTNEIFIDRWRIGALGGSVNVTANGLVHTGTTSANIFQKLSVPAYLFGQTVTLSAWANGKLVSGTVAIPKASEWPDSTTIFRASTDSDIGLELFVMTENGEKIVEFSAILKTPLTLKAVKLELGTSQTLCRSETDLDGFSLLEIPNYAIELMKCQQHQIVFSALTTGNTFFVIGSGIAASSVQARIPLYLPVAMRAAPTVVASGKFGLNTGSSIVEANLSYGVMNSQNTVTIYAAADGLTPGNAVYLTADNDASAKLILNANL